MEEQYSGPAPTSEETANSILGFVGLTGLLLGGYVAASSSWFWYAVLGPIDWVRGLRLNPTDSSMWPFDLLALAVLLVVAAIVAALTAPSYSSPTP